MLAAIVKKRQTGWGKLDCAESEIRCGCVMKENNCALMKKKEGCAGQRLDINTVIEKA